MALIIFNSIRGEIQGAKREIADNSRHITSLAATIWPLIWRVNGMEDHLAERTGYHAPRLIGENESPPPSQDDP